MAERRMGLRSRRRLALAAALAAATGLGTGGHAAPRDLAVPADKAWMHAETRLILHSTMAGLSRTALVDNSPDEHDVIAQFGAPDGAVVATLYLFHPAVPSVPLWFDRARFEVEARDLTRRGAPASADPIAFPPSGSGPPAALRQAYGLVAGPLRSTEVAALPLGDWLVVLRLSAPRLTAAALDAKTMEMVADLHLPAGSAPAAVPVTSCAAPLAYGHARPVKPDAGDMILSLVIGAATAQPSAAAASSPPPVWCREGTAAPLYAAYRANGDAHGYLLALGDSGRVVHVTPSLMAQMGKGPSRYTLTLNDLEGATVSYPPFDALPRPEQVFDAVRNGRETGHARGNQVNIQADALKR